MGVYWGLFVTRKIPRTGSGEAASFCNQHRMFRLMWNAWMLHVPDSDLQKACFSDIASGSHSGATWEKRVLPTFFTFFSQCFNFQVSNSLKVEKSNMYVHFSCEKLNCVLAHALATLSTEPTLDVMSAYKGFGVAAFGGSHLGRLGRRDSRITQLWWGRRRRRLNFLEVESKIASKISFFSSKEISCEKIHYPGTSWREWCQSFWQ